jgi:hypothetical protein
LSNEERQNLAYHRHAEPRRTVHQYYSLSLG